VQPVPSSPVAPDTVSAAIDDALETLDSLSSLGEDVEDEWQYVQDLAEAWRERFEEVAVARAGEPLSTERGAAVARACAEAASISDPHRAIDWLSTFPQVVFVALGERP
jgi:hypothetical protein